MRHSSHSRMHFKGSFWGWRKISSGKTKASLEGPRWVLQIIHLHPGRENNREATSDGFPPKVNIYFERSFWAWRNISSGKTKTPLEGPRRVLQIILLRPWRKINRNYTHDPFVPKVDIYFEGSFCRWRNIRSGKTKIPAEGPRPGLQIILLHPEHTINRGATRDPFVPKWESTLKDHFEDEDKLFATRQKYH